MKKYLLALLPGLLATGLAAQEPWPLERCVAYALEHNLDIRKQELAVAVRKTELTAGWLGHLPTLRLQVGQDFNWGRSVDMQELVIIRNKLTHATGASLNASVALFEGTARHYNRLAAGKAVEAARATAQELRERLTIDVTRAFLQLMLARQIYAYSQESYATISQQQDWTARLVEAGSQPKSALAEMQAQSASEKAAMVAASCRVRTATLELTRLMNLPPDSDFAAAEPFGQETLAVRVPMIPTTQIEDYLTKDPRLRGAKATVAERRHLLAAARGGFLPSLTVTAGYGTYYSSTAEEPFRTQLDENRNPSLSFTLGIPVFSAGTLLTRTRQSRLALETAQLEAERARVEIVDEIRTAAIEAENACQHYLSARETLDAMQELLQVTEAKYDLGAASALDYVLARNQHFKAMSDYLQAKWQYLFQLRLLEHYRP
ncbi:MAG: TolC family protein [Bacteroidales bacterium]|nr:TolC family protein [Bacteroidales bacterium]